MIVLLLVIVLFAFSTQWEALPSLRRISDRMQQTP